MVSRPLDRPSLGAAGQVYDRLSKKSATSRGEPRPVSYAVAFVSPHRAWPGCSVPSRRLDGKLKKDGKTPDTSLSRGRRSLSASARGDGSVLCVTGSCRLFPVQWVESRQTALCPWAICGRQVEERGTATPEQAGGVRAARANGACLSFGPCLEMADFVISRPIEVVIVIPGARRFWERSIHCPLPSPRASRDNGESLSR